MNPMWFDKVKALFTGVASEETSQEILGSVANGVAPSFRSPIGAGSIYGFGSNTTTPLVNIKGKGVVSIGCYNDVVTLKVIIDGVTLFNGVTVGYRHHTVNAEFQESVVIYCTGGTAGGGITWTLY